MADDDQPVRSPRARRLHRRHVVVLVLGGALFAGSLGYAAVYSGGWIVSTAAAVASGPAEPSCTTTRVPAPGPTTIVVNVYNASDRSGQARAVAKTLKKREFKVVAVGNDPRVAIVNGPGEVRYGKRGADAAQVVAWQLAGAKLVEDGRTSASVDLVVGVAFTGLVPTAPKPPPAPTSIVLNVYNTTFRTGLAATVAKELGARGFRTGKASNDPLRKMLLSAGEIRFGDDGEAAAKVVAQQLPGAALVKDQRAGASVDLVIGNEFTALVPAADIPAQPKPTPTPTPTVTRTVCVAAQR